MSMGCVDNYDVSPSRKQSQCPLDSLLAGSGRCSDAQLTVFILAGIRIIPTLLDIAHSHHARALAIFVDHQQLLNAVFVEEFLSLL
jgi:hypothetical protein